VKCQLLLKRHSGRSRSCLIEFLEACFDREQLVLESSLFCRIGFLRGCRRGLIREVCHRFSVVQETDAFETRPEQVFAGGVGAHDSHVFRKSLVSKHVIVVEMSVEQTSNGLVGYLLDGVYECPPGTRRNV
jgi:hypothetical protein